MFRFLEALLWKILKAVINKLGNYHTHKPNLKLNYVDKTKPNPNCKKIVPKPIQILDWARVGLTHPSCSTNGYVFPRLPFKYVPLLHF